MTDSDPDVWTEAHRSVGADVTSSIVSAVAAALDADPIDLPPLGEAINADALNQLWKPAGGRQGSVPIQLSFAYAGCVVTLGAGEPVTVRVDQSP